MLLTLLISRLFSTSLRLSRACYATTLTLFACIMSLDVPSYATTEPLHRFEDHTAAVKAVAWSPHQVIYPTYEPFYMNVCGEML